MVVGNYRPVSVLSGCSKILECMVHTQFTDYLRINGLLSNCQSGFRKGHSTVTCLLKFLNSIYNNIESGMLTGVVFLDLKKAFDMVDHHILLRKLRGVGITES